MPPLRPSKWERRTGVPNGVLADVYNDAYRKRAGAMAVDKLVKDEHEWDRFLQLLARRSATWAAAPRLELKEQLMALRKRGLVKLGTGNVGPRKGYKQRLLDSLIHHLTEIGMADVASCLATAVVQDMFPSKRGLTDASSQD